MRLKSDERELNEKLLSLHLRQKKMANFQYINMAADKAGLCVQG